MLSDPSEEFLLSSWDNALTDGTREYLKTEVDDPRICDIILADENVGQVEAVNSIWSRSDAELLGKVDNDCLQTVGGHRHSQRHTLISQDFVWWRAGTTFPTTSTTSAQGRGFRSTMGILRHPWTFGTGLLIKKSTYKELGPM